MVEEDGKKYTLAGKLLEISEQDIYNLKSGDKVQVWIKKEEARTFFDHFLKHKDSIWGIESISGSSFLLFETALAYQKKTSSLIYAGLFLLISMTSFFYAYKHLNDG